MDILIARQRLAPLQAETMAPHPYIPGMVSHEHMEVSHAQDRPEVRRTHCEAT